MGDRDAALARAAALVPALAGLVPVPAPQRTPQRSPPPRKVRSPVVSPSASSAALPAPPPPAPASPGGSASAALPLSGTAVFVSAAAVSARRCQLTRDIATRNGARLVDDARAATHAVGFGTLATLLAETGPLPPTVALVRADWVAASVGARAAVDADTYRLVNPASPGKRKAPEEPEAAGDTPAAQQPSPQQQQPQQQQQQQPQQQAPAPPLKRLASADFLSVAQMDRALERDPDSCPNDLAPVTTADPTNYANDDEIFDSLGSIILPQPTNPWSFLGLVTTHRDNAADVPDFHIMREQDELTLDPALSNLTSDRKVVAPRHAQRVAKAFACQPRQQQLRINSDVAAQNEFVAKALVELADTYKGENSVPDKFRILGYKRAATIVRKLPYVLTADNCTQLRQKRGFGQKTIEKIREIILNNGELSLLDARRNSEVRRVQQLFSGIYGVGDRRSLELYQQGFRTLDDLRGSQHILTQVQRIGLECYDDINTKMPRSEVEEIAGIVRVAAMELRPGIEFNVCGSYRRGRSMCGDCDILITHPDGVSHRNLLLPILERLDALSIITHSLSIHESEHGSETWLGIIRLHGEGRLRRRVDIKVYPANQYAFALLAFTGNAHFNRSMRSYAHKCGWSLSDFALREAVRDSNGNRISEFDGLVCNTERDIFHRMGMEYVPPEERDV